MLNHQIRNVTEMAHLVKIVDAPFCITESLFLSFNYVSKSSPRETLLDMKHVFLLAITSVYGVNRIIHSNM